MPDPRSKDKSQGQDAYAQLLDEIRHGRLLPGDRLTETELAARLGISRTPVREAIRALESDGLVTHRPRVGATVRAMDSAEVTELYEMRAVLEGTAARFAARAAYDAEITEMAQINSAMSDAVGDVAQLTALNQRFHAMLLHAARNRFLVRSVESIQKTLLILGPSTLEETSRAKGALAEHAAIIVALRAHDGDAAETAMRAHIEAAQRIRLQGLRAQLDR